MSLSDVLGHMDLSVYPQVALVLFLAVFVAVTARVARQSGAALAELAELPIDELTAVDREGGAQ